MVYITRHTNDDPHVLWDVIKELEGGPDRSVVVVGACFVETSLTHALVCHMHRDKRTTDEMFRSTGALGSFATKIRLGKLIGLYGKTAFDDLNIVKEVRNKFAHLAEINSFECKEIKSLTSNLKLAKRYTADVSRPQPPRQTGIPMKDQVSWVWSVDRDKRIKTSRGRFILTVQALNHGLFAFDENRMPDPLF